MTTRLRRFVFCHVALWALVAVQGFASDHHEEVNPNPAILIPDSWQHSAPIRPISRFIRHRHSEAEIGRREPLDFDSDHEDQEHDHADSHYHVESNYDANGAEPELSLNRICNAPDDLVTLEGVWIVDTSTVFSGGVNTSAWANRNLVELALGIDPGRLLRNDWEGGSLRLVFQNFGGEDGSQDTGDLIKYNNIDNPSPFTQIAELYFEQLLCDGKLRFKFGKVDANTEYNLTNYSLGFMNSAGGNQPTLFQVMPTYPAPSTSINVFVEASEHLHVSFGVFDGQLAEGVNTGRRGFHFGGPFWLVGEAHLHFGDHRPGRFGLGVWHHTFQRFERLNGTGTKNGQSGFYLHYDQVIWFENPTSAHIHSGHMPDPLHSHLTGGPWHGGQEQGVFGFLSYGVGEDSVNPLPQALTTGLICVGMIEGRDEDTFGAKIVWAELSDENPAFLSDAETNMEIFYRGRITPNLLIQPDLTYINNPGLAATVEHAWVFTTRAILEF